MILVGNQRGNSKDMADHLLKSENDTVIVHEVSGFIGDDLHSAFQESYAWSKFGKAKDHLYSLSLNPPKSANVSDEYFVKTINRAEKMLGLTGQPRAIVFHYKHDSEGNLRKHAHTVWSRITLDMKAVNIAFDHRKLQTLALQLYQENNWEIPLGFFNKQERDFSNYTHSEHQQARRCGKYADQIKRIYADAYSRSDTKQTFANALQEHGYILAKGNHAAYVAVDVHGEVYAIARSLPINTKEIRTKLGEPDDLPDVEQATQLAKKLFPEQLQAKETFEDAKPEVFESPIAKRVRQDPEYILSMITERESTFTHHGIAKALSTYINDPDEYRNAYETILASKRLVALNPDSYTPQKHWRFSTQDMVDLEINLQNIALKMSHNHSHKASRNNVNQAIQKQNSHMKSEFGSGLSSEQENAIRHITSDAQLSCVIGVAGAGKSTMLNAAREAWEASGYMVYGAALAGKAAEGLSQSSGIQSRTLASWELSWENGVNELVPHKSVLVIDEAAMIGSKQLSRIINHAKERGSKVVLLGDHRQLQAIESGAAFRNITDEIKPAVLSEVYRQKDDWQKQASKDFGQGNTQKALNTYLAYGRIEFNETHEDTIKALASDYLNDFWKVDRKTSQLALAHRKTDVKAINENIRDMRKEAGELGDGITYKTAHGRREFASGDRILFTRNDRALGGGVKNGMLGTVTKTEKGYLSVMLDDKAQDGEDRYFKFSPKEFEDFTHGYAVTVHKSQGATTDKTYVLASQSMDSAIAYVGLSRHRHETKLYVNAEELQTFGQLVSTLSRKRFKKSTLDYMDDNPAEKSKVQNQESELKTQNRLSGLWSRIKGEPQSPDCGISKKTSENRFSVPRELMHPNTTKPDAVAEKKRSDSKRLHSHGNALPETDLSQIRKGPSLEH